MMSHRRSIGHVNSPLSFWYVGRRTVTRYRGVGVDEHEAAVRLDGAMHDGRPRPLPPCLVVKNGSKGVADLRRDARSFVAHANGDAAAIEGHAGRRVVDA